MSDYSASTSSVMGLDTAALTTTGSTKRAPILYAKTTNKVRYQTAIKIWSSIIRSFSKTDKKHDLILESIGKMINVKCDNSKKEQLD